MNDEIEQRKQAAKDAGYTNPMCAACAKMSTPTSKECRKCMEATPAFNIAVREFMSACKGTMQ